MNFKFIYKNTFNIFNKINMVEDKIYFYEYIDIVNPTNKLLEIERRGKKENKYSWSILVEEIKRKVRNNIFIDDFIEKVNKNISFSKIYYNSINSYIDKIMDEKNKENEKYFYELQKIILLNSLDDKHFYFIQKYKIYQEMDLINKIYIKLIKTNDLTNIKKLEEFIYKHIETFEKRRKIIRLFIKKNKIDNISYGDDIIINIQNEKDIGLALEFIKHNNIIYKNVLLPKNIIIKEKNKYPTINYELNITKVFILKQISFPKEYIKKGKELIDSAKIFIKCILYNLFNINTNYYYKNIYTYYYVTQYSKANKNIKNNIYKYVHYFDLWRKRRIN